jgi:tRNA(Arg) A34 adenosine deaminase TadA
MDKLLLAAYEVALGSPGVSKARWRLGAVLVKGTTIVVAKGYNQIKTHPLLATVTPYPHLHAETSCLFRYGLDNTEGLDLYVVRIGKRNDIRLAKPCETCMYFIRKARLNRVYYSISNSEHGVIQL